MHGFSRSLGISILLHVLVVLVVVAVVNYHPVGVMLPQINQAFDKAIAITLTPLHRPPHPKPPPPKPVQQPPKPIAPPPAIQTQATEQVEQTAPPTTQKPPPPQNPPPDQQQEVQASYEQAANMILEANKRYPRQALLDGTEGDVTLTFTLNAQGTVLTYTIDKSSGWPVLDNEVVRLIHSVRFPPFPPGDNEQRKTLSVVLDFHLSHGP